MVQSNRKRFDSMKQQALWYGVDPKTGYTALTIRNLDSVAGGNYIVWYWYDYMMWSRLFATYEEACAWIETNGFEEVEWEASWWRAP